MKAARLHVWSMVLALALSLLIGGTALAHASFVRSDPTPNSSVPSAPERVTIWFTEPLEPSFSRIQVLATDGSQVDRSDSKPDPNNPTVLSVSLNTLPQGTYIVSWQVLSAVDGHITSGAFPFAVGETVTGGAFVATTLEVPPVSPLDVAARGIAYLAQAVLIGALAFKLLVWRPALKRAKIDESELDPAVTRRSQLIIRIAVGGAVVSTALWMLAQLSLSGQPLEIWLTTRVGRIWIGRAATVIALAVLSDNLILTRQATGRRGRVLTLVAAWLCLQLPLITTLTSHSAAVPNAALPMLTDWIHLLAISIWIGGLIQMVLVVPIALRGMAVEDRAWLLDSVVLNFSTLAAFAVAVLLISGLYLGTLHVGPPAALFETNYGRTLLVKIALVIPALLLGATNLLYVKPRLDKALDEPESRASAAVQRRYQRLVTAEALVAVTIVIIAGWLSVLPRGRDPQPTAAEADPIQLAQAAEDVRVELRIAPARIGINEYTVKVTDQSGRPVRDASRVSLRFRPIGKAIGTSEIETTPGDAGTYTAGGANISLNGLWQIEVAIRRPEAFDQFAAFRVQAQGDGRIIAQSDQLDLIANLIRVLDIYGTPIGAAGVILMTALWIFLAFRAAGPRGWAGIALVAPSAVLIPLALFGLIAFLQDTTPTAGLANLFVPDNQSIARGQALYEQKCISCHGPLGRGDGPAGQALAPRPADFTAGHTDAHPDGDVFYWIQNGVPNSAMPTFKDTLADAEIWHLVNYVRRLGAQAGTPPAAALSSTLPMTTSTSGVGISGDPVALALLERADATMNALTSLVEKQTLRDDAGNEEIIVFIYTAPDRQRSQFGNGATLIQIGSDEYHREPGGQWTKDRRSLAKKWPAFFFRSYGKVAGDAHIVDRERVDGRELTVIAFTYTGYAYRLWIDAETDRLLKYTMDDVDHHMVSVYSDFNRAPPIEPPRTKATPVPSTGSSTTPEATRP